jgi:hypothetical protein
VETYPNFGTAALNKAFVSNWIQLFSDSVKSAIGVRPIIYENTSGATTYFTPAVEGEHQLWEASWKGNGTVSPPTQASTPGWPPWTFWQWSDGADAIATANQVPGTVVSVDRDVFAGTTAQLNALLVHNVAGDYNHDGVVDAADYVVWRSSLGSAVNLAADGNNDEVVNQADYTFWRSHLGATSGSGSGSDLGAQGGVPEPTALMLFAFGGIAMASRRRTHRA